MHALRQGRRTDRPCILSVSSSILTGLYTVVTAIGRERHALPTRTTSWYPPTCHFLTQPVREREKSPSSADSLQCPTLSLRPPKLPWRQENAVARCEIKEPSAQFPR